MRTRPFRAVTIGLLGAALAAIPASGVIAGTASASAPTKSVAECASVSSARTPLGHSHGTDPNDLTPAQAAAAEKAMAAKLKAKGLTGKEKAAKVTIDVYVHVILRNNGTGGVSNAMINNQIAVLNKAYGGQGSAQNAPTNFKFAVKAIDRTKNTDWYNWSIYTDDDDTKAKNALYKGGLDDLNLYVTGLQDGLLGYATFPNELGSQKEDGVVVLNQSLPGGSATPYNLGDTLTHEAGHWLGLYHTFENGCTAPGDYVGDTPAQDDGDNIYSCDVTLDTCTASGKDPVHNYMSYGDDPCLDRFTAGQARRMTNTWNAYRAP